MAYTLEQALSKIGTEGYTGVDGLQRLVRETSAIATGAASNATTLLYSGNIGNTDIKSWKLVKGMESDFVNESGL